MKFNGIWNIATKFLEYSYLLYNSLNFYNKVAPIWKLPTGYCFYCFIRDNAKFITAMIHVDFSEVKLITSSSGNALTRIIFHIWSI